MSILDIFKTQISTKSVKAPTDNQRMLIVSLLSSKDFDPSGYAAAVNGKQVTYGDLKGCRVESAVRPNGSVGPHYPLIWDLNLEQVETVINYLDSRPKRTGGQPRRQQPTAAAPAQPVPTALEAKVDSLANGLEAIVEYLAAKEQSATPTEGHTKAAPTEPVAPVPTALEPGMTVTWQGKLYELVLTPKGRIGTRCLD